MSLPFPDFDYIRRIWRDYEPMCPSVFVVNGKTYAVPLTEDEKAELREWFKDVPRVKVGIGIVRANGKCLVPPLSRQKAREIMEQCAVW